MKDGLCFKDFSFIACSTSWQEWMEEQDHSPHDLKAKEWKNSLQKSRCWGSYYTFKEYGSKEEKTSHKVSPLFFLFLLLWLYWEYIVTFIKVLTMCHSWIHPLYHSLLFHLPTSPHSWNSFNSSHFSIIYMCTQYLFTIFTFLDPFLISSPTPSGTNP
jgi:hypothetical protein